MSEHIVERKPRPRDRVLIRLSGGRFFAIPEEAAAPLVVGAELSDEDVERLARIDLYLRGRDKAMRMLAIRGRSRREIDDALRAIGVDDPVRRGILSELEETGLVDDARFAREFVSVKKDVRRLGPHRLRADLQKLGVGRADLDGALATFDTDEQQRLARALAERAVRDGPVDEKAVRRVASMLTRKGFDYSVVNRIAAELARRMERGASDPEWTAPDDA
ncbi:MAG TPA: RecX family transcriptional regulator [Candidatus Krumholzibacteria bacterium]|nr:RecX family transcriptional regulator [Candidatus Krumholzibacteria bacterium]